ncbi:MAG: S41 family peptidase [Spirochaetaceae bacterium]|nr:S41 family peptidase [Spirochaetaceae bacterium]
MTSVCAMAIFSGCDRDPRGPPESLPPSAYTEDLDAAWTFIRDTYAYFDQTAVDWERARELLRPRAAEVRDHAGFVGLLEELIEHLCDHHAHLGVNTGTSPRLVPSGADLWAAHRGGMVVITAVRTDSAAERAGLRPGMQVVSIDGNPVAEAVANRLPQAVKRDHAGARDWALRTLLAGRHGASVSIEVQTESGLRAVTFQPGQWSRPEAPLTARRLGQGIGYVRLHDSLGQAALIPAWDEALERLHDTEGLVLDLHDTPGGGDAIVARPLMGRLVSSAQPYQRHELPDPRRPGTPRRTWTEVVKPSGPFTYDKPMAVLVGRSTGSMGEGVAIALDGMQRAAVLDAAVNRPLEHR